MTSSQRVLYKLKLLLRDLKTVKKPMFGQQEPSTRKPKYYSYSVLLQSLPNSNSSGSGCIWLCVELEAE